MARPAWIDAFLRRVPVQGSSVTGIVPPVPPNLGINRSAPYHPPVQPRGDQRPVGLPMFLRPGRFRGQRVPPAIGARRRFS